MVLSCFLKQFGILTSDRTDWHTAAYEHILARELTQRRRLGDPPGSKSFVNIFTRSGCHLVSFAFFPSNYSVFCWSNLRLAQAGEVNSALLSPRVFPSLNLGLKIFNCHANVKRKREDNGLLFVFLGKLPSFPAHLSRRRLQSIRKLWIRPPTFSRT